MKSLVRYGKNMWGKKPETFEMQISKITSGRDFKHLFQIISQVEELYGRSRMEAAQNVMSVLLWVDF